MKVQTEKKKKIEKIPKIKINKRKTMETEKKMKIEEIPKIRINSKTNENPMEIEKKKKLQ
jgi:hypothetical protein